MRYPYGAAHEQFPLDGVERIRQVEQLGATAVCLMNVSGADPHGAIEVYRDHVLPSLRRGRVPPP